MQRCFDVQVQPSHARSAPGGVAWWLRGRVGDGAVRIAAELAAGADDLDPDDSDDDGGSELAYNAARRKRMIDIASSASRDSRDRARRARGRLRSRRWLPQLRKFVGLSARFGVARNRTLHVDLAQRLPNSRESRGGTRISAAIPARQCRSGTCAPERSRVEKTEALPSGLPYRSRMGLRGRDRLGMAPGSVG
jgi:hypothetical protein